MLRILSDMAQKSPIFSLALCVVIAGCATPRATDELSSGLAPPAWPTQLQTVPGEADVPEHWLSTFESTELNGFVMEVLDRNLALKQQRAQVDTLRERVSITRADRLPAVNLSLSGQRSRFQPTLAVSENYTVSALLTQELDIWGRLSASQRAAQLDYQAAELRYLQARRQTAADATSAIFDAITAEQLRQLFSQRLITLTSSLDIIQRGYRSGLNEALDVYLAQTSLEQERARVASQSQASFTARTNLQLLLAEYPDASIKTTPRLPRLGPVPGIGAPSSVLTRRPDIQAAWLDLLSADAALAAAHKNRFPSLTLTASGSDVDNALHTLLDGGQLGWSVAASLFAPLYQGGRLKSLERQAQLAVAQAEAAYLEVVYRAFAQVQNELNNAVELSRQLAALQVAEANAANALALATDQYQRGLVNYATVLESQRRAFDTQTNVIQLRNQQLASRVRLLLALGGEV